MWRISPRCLAAPRKIFYGVGDSKGLGTGNEAFDAATNVVNNPCQIKSC